MNKKINIAGISISSFTSIEQAIETEIITPSGIKSGVAIAVNPEKIMIAKKNKQLAELLAKASLKYPDGIGVSYVMSKKSRQYVARIPGCELWEKVMLKSAEQKIPVFLVGASATVLQQTQSKLMVQGVNIVGAINGYFNQTDEAKVIAQIKASGAQIISVALGSPKQELFMFECHKAIPTSFFMGVGGSYDVFTGNVKRAPLGFIKFHCEWLYRLLSQPTRINRQINLIKYILLYLMKKL